MKSFRVLLIILALVMLVTSTGCLRASTPEAAPSQTADLNATVDAAVAQTAQVAASYTATPDLDATVDSAVAATDAAKSSLQATIESGVEATMAAMPSPTPVPVEQLSEEQLAAEVETAAAEASTACDELASTTTAATADAVLTQEEIELILYMLEMSQDEIDQALALADAYASYYGELAEETIELLYLIEEDMSTLIEYTDEVADLMGDAIQMLEEGQEVTQEVIAALQTKSQELNDKATALQEAAANWKEQLGTELENRPQKFANFQPENTAETRADALTDARDYIDAVKESMTDGKISRDEMDRIGQLSANASAGLRNAGGDGMSSFADNIDTLTLQLSRGEMPQARDGITQLDRDFPERPKR